MSKRHTDNTPDEKAPKINNISDSVLVEAARNGDTTAVRVGLEKLSPDTDSKTVAFDAVHEACRGNHDECLALLLPYVETTQMGFGMLLSECIHADHTACTEVLLQHWKSVCSNVAFVPHGQEDNKDRACPAMWADPAVFQVLIDAGADIETEDDMGRSPLHWSCYSGTLAVVKMLVEAGAGVCVADNKEATCLILAANFGHTETVRYLVGLKDVDVNHEQNIGHTALHWAIQEGHCDVMQVLIDAGSDIEAKDEKGRSPLHWSCFSGKIAVVKMLVKAGAGVRFTDNNGITCLIIASRFGHTETVRYLVGLKDVDVNHADTSGFAALHYAVQQNHPDVMQVLIDAGADIEAMEEKGRSPLHVACLSGSLAVVKMLLKAGAGVCVLSNGGSTCLHFAAHHGHTEIVRYLVDLPEVDVNHQGMNDQSALHYAARQRHPDVVEVLIDAGADIEAQDNDGYSPLFLPSISGGVDTVKVLLRAGADVRATDNTGNTCLMLAGANGHIETVRTLLCMPEVDLDHARDGGSTALHYAVHVTPTDVLQALLDAGADIEAKDAEGRSALLVASSTGEEKSVKVLVEAGAEVRATDDEGNTCLILAAYFGYTDIVRYLLCLSDVHDRDAEGDTALHLAAHQKLPDVVKLLLEHGADKSLCNEAGETALDNAAAGGCRECCRLLS